MPRFRASGEKLFTLKLFSNPCLTYTSWSDACATKLDYELNCATAGFKQPYSRHCEQMDPSGTFCRLVPAINFFFSFLLKGVCVCVCLSLHRIVIKSCNTNISSSDSQPRHRKELEVQWVTFCWDETNFGRTTEGTVYSSSTFMFSVFIVCCMAGL